MQGISPSLSSGRAVQHPDAPESGLMPLLYEQPVPSLTLSAPGQIAVSVLAGLAVVVAHVLSAGATARSDWSWMLGAILTSSLLTLYYATYTFRRLWTRLNRLLAHQQRSSFANRLRQFINNRLLAIGGLAFGLLNCAMAFAFGVGSATPAGLATYYAGVFAAGFSCGMAVTGIYGVVRVVSSFAREMDPQIDYAAPDRCGGFLFIGQTLLRFSLVTLFVGVLISLYILNATWLHEGNRWAEALMWFWAVFPFAASLFVLLAPAIEIHHHLEAFKVAEERTLRRDLMEVRQRLRDDTTPPAERPALREEYDYFVRLRQDLYRMRTWPFDPFTGTEYAGMFAAHGTVVWPYLQRLISWTT